MQRRLLGWSQWRKASWAFEFGFGWIFINEAREGILASILKSIVE